MRRSVKDAIAGAAGSPPVRLASLGGGCIGEVYRAVFGRHYPPMTLVVVDALLEAEALIEIEATAVVPD